MALGHGMGGFAEDYEYLARSVAQTGVVTVQFYTYEGGGEDARDFAADQVRLPCTILIAHWCTIRAVVVFYTTSLRSPPLRYGCSAVLHCTTRQRCAVVVRLSLAHTTIQYNKEMALYSHQTAARQEHNTVSAGAQA
jgi:hypothetical protein